jgi:hypothetical protein
MRNSGITRTGLAALVARGPAYRILTSKPRKVCGCKRVYSWTASHFSSKDHAKEHLLIKRFLPLIIVALAVAARAAFARGEGYGQGESPAQICKNELATLCAADFNSLYAPGGSAANVMGKCVSKHARAAAVNHTNAAKARKAECSAVRAAFTAKYGGKAASAFGKCVSAKSIGTLRRTTRLKAVIARRDDFGAARRFSGGEYVDAKATEGGMR